MIRILRGPEPDELRRVRRRELSRAVLAWADGAAARENEGGGKKIVFSEIDVAKPGLYHAQHRKCAYCERMPGLTNQPVEHFRPKAGAVRGDPRISRTKQTLDPEHYWWLAWTWENLLFACATCNGRGNKASWFPLETGKPALPLPPRQPLAEIPAVHRDLASERRMLLDPSVDDPMTCLQWLPENPDAVEWEDLRWKPFGTDAGGRGHTTIGTLGLDSELPDDVSAHVRAHVLPKIARLLLARQSLDKAVADATWDELEKMFAPTLPYLAATYDAIEWLLDQPAMTGVRAFVGRTLLRPGAKGTDPPSQDLPDPAVLLALPEELRLRVRADLWTTREGILALCSASTFSVQTLADVLGRALEEVKNKCRELEKTGRLRRSLDASGAAVFEAAPAISV